MKEKGRGWEGNDCTSFTVLNPFPIAVQNFQTSDNLERNGSVFGAFGDGSSATLDVYYQFRFGCFQLAL